MAEPAKGESNDSSEPGVTGVNTANGPAVWGWANPNGRGVVGVSDTGTGVWGHTKTGRAVVGAVDAEGVGVWGHTKTGRAVVGAVDVEGTGVWGHTKAGTGVVGVVDNSGVGVSGKCDAGDGVVGTGRRGVVGISPTYQGVYGKSVDNAGVVGESDKMHAVFGISHGNQSAGIYGTNTAGGHAALFDGNVIVAGKLEVRGDIEVTGDLHLQGADYAEALSAGEPNILAGCVVVVGEDGNVRPCFSDYDPAVAGVVSGAGGIRPAIVLDRHDHSVSVALMGKVWCLADAEAAPIRPGNLLTTSATRGHARCVTEPSRALGTIIGKALTPLLSGRGLVRILVSPR